MKIAMFTNTYLPHVGGVAKSIKTLEDECRRRGHEVRVIAPEFDGAEESPDVLRIPAIQHFNGSDFSVRLPSPALIRRFMDDFQPDVIHSHHPFLLGDTALREAWKSGIPVVFTHHTLYERYTHYVPLDSPALQRLAIQLASEYCNLCRHIIAPSESVEKLLIERGVTAPIQSIPTGIDTRFFAAGDGASFRAAHGIPAEAVVIGHVGRLAKEKNLEYLAGAVKAYLGQDPAAVFLLVGDGPEKEMVERMLEEDGTGDRLFAVGSRTGTDLADAYAAMDVFVFASQSETQGMVLAEAMATGVPVVALDASGVREIVRDGENGVMLAGDAFAEEFTAAIGRLAGDGEFRGHCGAKAAETAAEYDQSVTAEKVLQLYEKLARDAALEESEEPTPWDRFLHGVGIEWDLVAAKVAAVAAVVVDTSATEARLR